jgi:hypothetical protein
MYLLGKKILCSRDINQRSLQYLIVFKFGLTFLREIRCILKNYDTKIGPKLENCKELQTY